MLTCNKQIALFSMVCTLNDHRIDVKMWLVVPIEF